MIYDNNNWISPSRKIETRVELYNGSTLIDTYTKSKAIKKYKIERVGEESKFFGFGISHKLILELTDKDRLIDISNDNYFNIYMGTGVDLISSTPSFYVKEVKRDENTNGLTITAYDKLEEAAKHTVAELNLKAPYTLWNVLNTIVTFLGLGGIGIYNEYDTQISNILDIRYPDGANLDGTETLREVLNAIAEITQTIYYLDCGNILMLKKLNYAYSSIAIQQINKSNYYTLETKVAQKLTAICSATELGDNVTASSGTDGITQYIRNNPFLELRNDIADILDDAIADIAGLTIVPYTCKWRGNFSYEPGDLIEIVTKDNKTITTNLLNDTIEYNGGLTQTSSWGYSGSAQTASNPTTLGEALKQTYAKVDKANKEIEIVAGETAAIKLTTDNINASVSQLDNNVNDLTQVVNTKVSPEDVTISIERVLKQGVESVITATGFVFNQDGLNISKNNSDIATNINEDGMIISKEDKEVLKADNEGVKAIDLHATTYLIIGNNSRFEDYNGSRTGCFWIGG